MIVWGECRSLDHGCLVGEDAYMLSGAMLSSGLCVGENAPVGAGAFVIQRVQRRCNNLGAARVVEVRYMPCEMAAEINAKEIAEKW